MDLKQEKELVERARKDAEAFGQLYDYYYSQIFGYILRRTANIEIARDVTSEVFFKSLKNIGRFHWRDIPFSSWLYRIAAHELVNYFRGNKPRQSSLEDVSNSISISNPSTEAEILQAEADLERHQDFLALRESLKIALRLSLPLEVKGMLK